MDINPELCLKMRENIHLEAEDDYEENLSIADALEAESQLVEKQKCPSSYFMEGDLWYYWFSACHSLIISTSASLFPPGRLWKCFRARSGTYQHALANPWYFQAPLFLSTWTRLWIACTFFELRLCPVDRWLCQLHSRSLSSRWRWTDCSCIVSGLQGEGLHAGGVAFSSLVSVGVGP